MKRFRIWHQLRTSLWPIPILYVLIGVAISFATVALDEGTLVSVEFIGGPDAALAILGAIAASMVTLTGIVLTIVLVVVQLAMGQFSPRSPTPCWRCGKSPRPRKEHRFRVWPSWSHSFS